VQVVFMQDTTRNAVFGTVSCRNLSIVDAIMNKLDRAAHDMEHTIVERTRELEEERRKSELLLYNMMPQ